MKIKRQPLSPLYVQLGTIPYGECLIFEFAPHQKHRAGDVFMKLESCSSYRYQDRVNNDRCAVANMRSGALAYVARTRPCYPVQVDATLID